jgi:serine/threonine-protein kinase RsbW
VIFKQVKGMITETFPGIYENLQKIGDYVGRVAENAGFDEFGIYAVQLAVDEACTNIIEHAYGGEGKGLIDVTAEDIQDGIMIYLRDHGKPFDPEKIPIPQTNLPLEDIQPRGVGLYLMRKMMDEVRFEFSPDKGNLCIMTKRK